MTEERREWTVRGHEEAPIEDRVRHVVGRVGTVLRTHCDRFDGARVHQGNVVFGGAHESHLISAVVGRDTRSGALSVRVLVNGNGGARWAAITFPLVMFATLIASIKVVGGAPGVLGGAILGLVAGAVGAYIAYVWAPKLGFDGGGRGRVVGVVGSVQNALKPSFEHMGLSLEAADTVVFEGVDQGSGDASPRWNSALREAVAALAT